MMRRWDSAVAIPQEGMATPWGMVQRIQRIASGVYWATAAMSGGIMLTPQTAQQLLSPQACRIGQFHESWLFFKEDDAVAAPLLEHPEWGERLGLCAATSTYDPEAVLRRWFPSYFEQPVQMALFVEERRPCNGAAE